MQKVTLYLCSQVSILLKILVNGIWSPSHVFNLAVASFFFISELS